MMKRSTLRAYWIFCVLAIWINSGFAQTDNASRTIKFDAYHSHTWLDTLPQPGLNHYHILHGPARAAHALQTLGWDVRVQLSRWNSASLQDVDVVVFNLVSADRPPFAVAEIEAIKEYINRGGGVLFITDHTNCYFHNHVLGPLMEELHIELRSELACDKPPRALSTGNGWITITSFKDHPMVESLQHIAFQSGGCVDSKHAIAWTSNSGWADWGVVPPYGDAKSLGFFGDFRKQPAELGGPQGVILAKQFGEGRIAIVADQNCLGGMFLNYADNRRLWLQTIQWLAQKSICPSDSEPLHTIVDRPEPERGLIWCVEDLSNSRFAFGNGGPDGLYYFFGWLNKIADARATDRKLLHATVAFFPIVDLLKNENWREIALEYIRQPNKTLLVFGTASDAHDISGIAAELGWPEISDSFTSGGLSWFGPSNNRLVYLADTSTLTNRRFPKPEKEADGEYTGIQNRWETWLESRGIERVGHFGEDQSWLDELDKLDK